MIVLWIILGVLGCVALLTFILSFICFMIIFYSPKRKPLGENEYGIPNGKIYEPYRENFVAWTKKVRAMPHKEVEVKSFDGLTLRGNYYEYSPDAPIELMFHGYRGDSERDLSGGVLRCFSLERSVLLVDQRASGKSDGKVITFGVKESQDVLPWVNYIIDNINKDAKILITGVSMGAATVMIASALELPKNVIAVLADCGYTSAKDIIKKVIRDMKLPPNLLYPFAKLGAKIFGGFNLEETSPVTAMENCKLPIMFLHGDDDRFVPCEMSVRNFNACKHKNKKLTVIKGAGHGLCYMADPELYMREIRDFFDTIIEKS